MASDSDENLDTSHDGDNLGAQKEGGWSNDDIETLIEAVRNQSILYNFKSKENKNAGKKELVWLNISEVLGKEASECNKKKWKYLRDTFNKVTKQNKGKSGKSGKRLKKPWEFYDNLRFLKYHIATNMSSSGNLDKLPAPDETPNSDDGAVDCNPDNIAEGGSTIQSLEHQKGNTNSAKKIKMSDQVDNALLGYLSNQSQVKDSTYHYCMSLAESLRKLSPAQGSYAKMRIQQLLYEIEFPQYTSMHSSDNGA